MSIHYIRFDESTNELLLHDGERVHRVDLSALADNSAGVPFTDQDKAKLDTIEIGATSDQTAAEIKSAYESNDNTNAFTDADESKLDGIQAGAQANPKRRAPAKKPTASKK